MFLNKITVCFKYRVGWKMKCLSLILLLLSISTSANATENINVLKSLSSINESKIPQDSLHCEINGTKSVGIYNGVTVGDVLADFINFTLLESSAKRHSFMCDGKGMMDCTLQYGEKENSKNPGWGSYLKFKYNEKNGSVIPESLECFQVP